MEALTAMTCGVRSVVPKSMGGSSLRTTSRPASRAIFSMAERLAVSSVTRSGVFARMSLVPQRRMTRE